jgi:hypothetical protein
VCLTSGSCSESHERHETYRSGNYNAALQTKGGANANIWYRIDLGIPHVQATSRIGKNEGQIIEKSARGVSTHPVKIGVRAGDRNSLRRGPKNRPNAANDDGLQRCTPRTER